MHSWSEQSRTERTKQRWNHLVPLRWRKDASAGDESSAWLWCCFHMYMDVSIDHKTSAHLQTAFTEMRKQFVQLRVKFRAFTEPSFCNTRHDQAIDCCCVLTIILTRLALSIHLLLKQFKWRCRWRWHHSSKVASHLLHFSIALANEERSVCLQNIFTDACLEMKSSSVNNHCQGVSTSTGQAVCCVHHLKLSWEQLGFKPI